MKKVVRFSISWKNVIGISIFLMVIGCSKHIYEVAYPTLVDGKYDTEFPYKECADQLNDISQTIKQINYIAYYKSYQFNTESNVLISTVSDAIDKDIFDNEVYFNETVSGTGTVIYYENNNLALLTCAHIGNYPDTLLTYFESLGDEEPTVIQNISFKIRENFFVNGIPGATDFSPLLVDQQRDIAILGKRHVLDPYRQIKVFDYPAGQSEELDWGSFVYIFGYPMGHKMVTKGIVSNPEDALSGSFIIDALFNRGFSGGIILAIKDGVPNFELVGMVKSVSASYNYALVPDLTTDDEHYNTYFPYKGSSFIKRAESINYGITFT
ncbi:MAG: serine protease, partial [Candidatus Neomarinimicrobiota bacterium]